MALSSATSSQSALQRNLDHLAGLTHDPGQVDALADEQAELAEETVGTMDRDHPVLGAIALDDRHGPRLDDEEGLSRSPGGEQDLARFDGAHPPEPAKALPLLLVETREGAVTVGGLGKTDPRWTRDAGAHAPMPRCVSRPAGRAGSAFRVNVRDHYADLVDEAPGPVSPGWSERISG